MGYFINTEDFREYVERHFLTVPFVKILFDDDTVPRGAERVTVHHMFTKSELDEFSSHGLDIRDSVFSKLYDKAYSELVEYVIRAFIGRAVDGIRHPAKTPYHKYLKSMHEVLYYPDNSILITDDDELLGELEQHDDYEMSTDPLSFSQELYHVGSLKAPRIPSRVMDIWSYPGMCKMIDFKKTAALLFEWPASVEITLYTTDVAIRENSKYSVVNIEVPYQIKVSSELKTCVLQK